MSEIFENALIRGGPEDRSRRGDQQLGVIVYSKSFRLPQDEDRPERKPS